MQVGPLVITATSCNNCESEFSEAAFIVSYTVQGYIDAELRHGGYEVAEMCAILLCGLMLIRVSMLPSFQAERTASLPDIMRLELYTFTSGCAARLLVQTQHGFLALVSRLQCSSLGPGIIFGQVPPQQASTLCHTDQG